MASLSESQKNPSEIMRLESLPKHEFYNRYIRKEGETVLDAEAFDKKFGAKAQIVANVNELHNAQVITYNDAPTHTG